MNPTDKRLRTTLSVVLLAFILIVILVVVAAVVVAIANNCFDELDGCS